MKIIPVRPFFPPKNRIPTDKIPTNNLVIEIGCGVGWHAIQFAKKNPNVNFIALERTQEKFFSFQQRLNNHPDIKNIIPINKDAQDWLPVHVKANSVKKYFLLYPNPYPKESQANKRWHRSSLMHFMIESLIPNGEIELATNMEFYCSEAKLYFKEFWKLPFEESLINNNKSFLPRTHFEKKYLLRGETCYNLKVFKK